jgi:S-DNA-T family DNA segregation ATPase FtsK/SpoIIIE
LRELMSFSTISKRTALKMTDLLKPSKLRETLNGLNELIADYSEKNIDITQRYNEEKVKRHRLFESNRNSLDQASEKKLKELEEQFQSRKISIELEAKEASQKIQQEIDLQKDKFTLEHEGISETTRRHSREAILVKRKANEEDIGNLKAEWTSMLAIVNDCNDFCNEATPLLKKFSAVLPANDLCDSEFPLSEEKDATLEGQMLKCNISPYFDQLNDLFEQSQQCYKKLKKAPLTSLFLKIPPLLILTLLTFIHIGLYFLGSSQKIEQLSINNLGMSFAATAGVTILLLILHKVTSATRLNILSKNVSELQGIAELCTTVTKVQLEQAVSIENHKLTEFTREEDSRINKEIREVDLNKNTELRQLKDELRKESKAIEINAAEQMGKLAEKQTTLLEKLEIESAAELTNFLTHFDTDAKAISSKEESELELLSTKWQKQWIQKLEDFEFVNKNSQNKENILFPSWETSLDNWQPPKTFDGASPFGSLKMDLKKELSFPKNGSIELDESVPFSIPALLEFPGDGSLLVSTKEDGHKLAVELIQNTVLRLLMTLPPGKARFTFIDPLALGETFAGFMHLNDYKEDLTGGRISTNSRQIEQQLADLNDHMENVIQKYLRNEFTDICHYNDEVGEIAEPFRFLVINDFPVNFSEEAVKRLVSIAKSGARCGVYIIIHQDMRHSIPGDFDISDIEKNCVSLEYLFGDLDWKNCGFKLADFNKESLPSIPVMNEIIKRVGAASIDATRVEIPFSKISGDAIWQESSADDLKAPIGLTGAKQQFITFGHGTNQHCLLAGKTGSGKSNLMHVIICNMARRYSPQELEFYLVDFKKGVEFKPYASLKLPHAKAIAIESDRGFGLSVLRKIDEDLQLRGEKLRDASVQNISQYRSTTGEAMARILLVIDEFQEIFVEDDMISQEASLLLDRIVRQGRAFGIHVILGSQTLAGSYSLPRSTMGQMTIRIALQCSESDSYVILSENNSAARLLSRPGEAIYNNNAGLAEGNNPFQTAFLSEDDKSQIIANLAEKEDCSAFIFEGNIPANINTNRDFKELLTQDPDNLSLLLLGEPNAIQPAQSILLENTAGQNILITGQKEESALSLLASSIFSLALHLNDECEFIILNGSSADKPRESFFETIKSKIPHSVKVIKPNEAIAAITELHENMKSRIDSNSKKKTFLFIHGLQRFRKLKQEDNFSWDEEEKNAGSLLAEILAEGPEQKIHTICWVDSWNSLSRNITRKTMNEFEYRVIFQMSQSDSVNLIDSPEATKLGLHTALMFNEQTGDMLKFRPFSLPDEISFLKLEQKLTALDS